MREMTGKEIFERYLKDSGRTMMPQDIDRHAAEIDSEAVTVIRILGSFRGKFNAEIYRVIFKMAADYVCDEFARLDREDAEVEEVIEQLEFALMAEAIEENRMRQTAAKERES
jgi:hypothetical protein